MPARRPTRSRSGRRRRRHPWEDASDRELLAMRLCDLGVTLEGSWLEEPVARAVAELEARDLRLRPHFWLSTEWFSPDTTLGVAIPFFLAHPRLMRLERAQMLEVEGGTRRQCLMLLRHELGHVVQHGFGLSRRPAWRRHFGRASTPYPDYYRPNPASRRYVFHLPYWYAQSHPEEDFAETFAVWLGSRRWRHEYEGWPALRKLEYVDALMAELAGCRPARLGRAQVEPISKLRSTLREYYEGKQERFGGLPTTIYDRDLQRIFTSRSRRGEPAAAFLRRHGDDLRRMVAEGTGKREFALEVVLDEMISRCRELELRAVGPRRDLLTRLAILLAARSVQYTYRGREWHAL